MASQRDVTQLGADGPASWSATTWRRRSIDREVGTANYMNPTRREGVPVLSSVNFVLGSLVPRAFAK